MAAATSFVRDFIVSTYFPPSPVLQINAVNLSPKIYFYFTIYPECCNSFSVLLQKYLSIFQLLTLLTKNKDLQNLLPALCRKTVGFPVLNGLAAVTAMMPA